MSAGIFSCRLPLPTNFRFQDILSFHSRDTLAVSEAVAAKQLRKGMVWHGSPACLTLRFLPLWAEIELGIDVPVSFDIGELSALALRMLGLNQSIDVFEGSVGQSPGSKSALPLQFRYDVNLFKWSGYGIPAVYIATRMHSM